MYILYILASLFTCLLGCTTESNILVVSDIEHLHQTKATVTDLIKDGSNACLVICYTTGNGTYILSDEEYNMVDAKTLIEYVITNHMNGKITGAAYYSEPHMLRYVKEIIDRYVVIQEVFYGSDLGLVYITDSNYRCADIYMCGGV